MEFVRGHHGQFERESSEAVLRFGIKSARVTEPCMFAGQGAYICFLMEACFEEDGVGLAPVYGPMDVWGGFFSSSEFQV